MWRCFVRDQARVPSVAGAGSSLFRNRNSFVGNCCKSGMSLVRPVTAASTATGGTHRMCVKFSEIFLRVTPMTTSLIATL